MELNTISGLAIAGVICSVVLSMGVPIALFIAGRVKLKARISSFFIGAGTYLLFAMLLEQLLHVLVIQFCGLNAQSRPYAILFAVKNTAFNSVYATKNHAY